MCVCVCEGVRVVYVCMHVCKCEWVCATIDSHSLIRYNLINIMSGMLLIAEEGKGV